MEKEFDYAGAVKELEEIAVKVEDPSVGIDGIDVYIKRADELINACRAYLRDAEKGLGALDER